MKSSSPRILVVDDEPAVVELMRYNLSKAHFEVITAADGHQALAQAYQTQPDLILLDLMLPGLDGFDVCRELRRTSNIPIIMLTARGEEIDRIVGLELGADDYICKPFSIRELIARVKAVLRRVQHGEFSKGDELKGPAGLRLNFECREATIGDIDLGLTRLEFDLLYILLLNAERVLTRDRLLGEVWGYDFVGDTRAVDSAIKRLRARLRQADPRADCIEAVRGLGYKFRRESRYET